ncbi:MAG: GAK system CofD-like protein [Planctomycetes bacterium]|nr:GAK system CofD-like protein [Planctomycetota bacterium]
MTRIPISRLARLPDPLRLERFRRAPELGPRILFFSGGSALKELSRELKQYSHNSIHLVTPFDSGGSSESLRRAFKMPSVGDLRSRLLSLADERLAGNREIVELFSRRLPHGESAVRLRTRLDDLVAGRDELMSQVPAPVARILRSHLRTFVRRMPADFDLAGASLGNLALTGGYLEHGRDIDSVAYLYSRLLEVRGQVRCIVDAHLDLAAELVDGSRLGRQHLLTAKEAPPISSPVRNIRLVDRENGDADTSVAIERSVGMAITEADLIVYPMGSFYSSLAANLLPKGVGSAIGRAGCPRLYVPSSDRDPEMLGLSVGAAAEYIVRTVTGREAIEAARGEALDLVLVDSKAGLYPAGLELERIQALGAQVVDLDLTTGSSAPLLDAAKLAAVLLSLC